MVFQKKFKEYNHKLTRLFENLNKNKLEQLVSLFKEKEDFIFLMNEFKKYSYEANPIEMINTLEILENKKIKIKLLKNKEDLILYLEKLFILKNIYLIHRIVSVISKYKTDNIYFQKSYKILKKKHFLDSSSYFIFSHIFYNKKDYVYFIDAYNNALLTNIFDYDTFQQFNRIYDKYMGIDFHKMVLEKIYKDKKLLAKYF